MQQHDPQDCTTFTGHGGCPLLTEGSCRLPALWRALCKPRQGCASCRKCQNNNCDTLLVCDNFPKLSQAAATVKIAIETHFTKWVSVAIFTNAAAWGALHRLSNGSLKPTAGNPMLPSVLLYITALEIGQGGPHYFRLVPSKLTITNSRLILRGRKLRCSKQESIALGLAQPRRGAQPGRGTVL